LIPLEAVLVNDGVEFSFCFSGSVLPDRLMVTVSISKRPNADFD
jgi:hypothetical protein